MECRIGPRRTYHPENYKSCCWNTQTEQRDPHRERNAECKSNFSKVIKTFWSIFWRVFLIELYHRNEPLSLRYKSGNNQKFRSGYSWRSLRYEVGECRLLAMETLWGSSPETDFMHSRVGPGDLDNPPFSLWERLGPISLLILHESPLGRLAVFTDSERYSDSQRRRHAFVSKFGLHIFICESMYHILSVVHNFARREVKRDDRKCYSQ